jgi:ATP-grasp ribosomal peptide maturase
MSIAQERPVLVATRLDDTTAEPVIAELHRRGVPVVRFDPGDFPGTLTVSARFDGERWDGRIETGSRTARLPGPRSLWWRRPSGFNFKHLESQDANYALHQARLGFGGLLVCLPDCLYVNHPHRIADAEYKPVQLAAAARSGLQVPSTLLTSSPQDAREFIAARNAEGNRVLHKPLATPMWRTAEGEMRIVGVDIVTAADIDDSVAGTMHLFQQAVDKMSDLRVTVIGETVFTVRITSDLLDWRTDYDALAYEVAELDCATKAGIRRYMNRFGLVFGAFDFAVDRDGTPWFLECNPNGQFLWFEEPTGLPLTTAMADLLESGK